MTQARARQHQRHRNLSACHCGPRLGGARACTCCGKNSRRLLSSRALRSTSIRCCRWGEGGERAHLSGSAGEQRNRWLRHGEPSTGPGGAAAGVRQGPRCRSAPLCAFFSARDTFPQAKVSLVSSDALPPGPEARALPSPAHLDRVGGQELLEELGHKLKGGGGGRCGASGMGVHAAWPAGVLMGLAGVLAP